MQRIALLGTLTILGLSGLLQRQWERAPNDPAMVAAAANVDRVPMNIDEWRGQPLELDSTDMIRAGYVGSFWRRYEHAKNGKVVSVLLVCGAPGRISVHTPDVCYAGAGFEMIAEPTRATFRLPGIAGRSEFWKADFTKPKDPAPAKLRIYYAWSGGGAWQAVDNPRLSFTSLPVLYKLYVVCETTSAGERQNVDAAQEFMQQLLPELHGILKERPNP